MDVSGEYRIPAPRERVWQALNDTEVLRQCIPGCQSLERTSDTELKATAAVKVGPVRAAFKGAVTLSDIDPPNGYTISGEGQGGVAGFARGNAKVGLEEDGDGTLLRYQAQATVGGKLAQVGQRLLQSTADKFAGEFFGKFSELVGAAEIPAPEAPAVEEAPAPAAAPEAAPGLPPWLWIAAVLAAVAVLLVAFGV